MNLVASQTGKLQPMFLERRIAAPPKAQKPARVAPPQEKSNCGTSTNELFQTVRAQTGQKAPVFFIHPLEAEPDEQVRLSKPIRTPSQLRAAIERADAAKQRRAPQPGGFYEGVLRATGKDPLSTRTQALHARDLENLLESEGKLTPPALQHFSFAVIKKRKAPARENCADHHAPLTTLIADHANRTGLGHEHILVLAEGCMGDVIGNALPRVSVIPFEFLPRSGGNGFELVVRVGRNLFGRGIVPHIGQPRLAVLEEIRKYHPNATIIPVNVVSPDISLEVPPEIRKLLDRYGIPDVEHHIFQGCTHPVRQKSVM